MEEAIDFIDESNRLDREMKQRTETKENLANIDRLVKLAEAVLSKSNDTPAEPKEKALSKEEAQMQEANIRLLEKLYSTMSEGNKGSDEHNKGVLEAVKEVSRMQGDSLASLAENSASVLHLFSASGNDKVKDILTCLRDTQETARAQHEAGTKMVSEMMQQNGEATRGLIASQNSQNEAMIDQQAKMLAEQQKANKQNAEDMKQLTNTMGNGMHYLGNSIGHALIAGFSQAVQPLLQIASASQQGPAQMITNNVQVNNNNSSNDHRLQINAPTSTVNNAMTLNGALQPDSGGNRAINAPPAPRRLLANRAPFSFAPSSAPPPSQSQEKCDAEQERTSKQHKTERNKRDRDGNNAHAADADGPAAAAAPNRAPAVGSLSQSSPATNDDSTH